MATIDYNCHKDCFVQNEQGITMQYTMLLIQKGDTNRHMCLTDFTV